MDAIEEFRERVARNIKAIRADREFIDLSNTWIRESIRHEYSQNFTWLGRPVIQMPPDLYAVQELIWATRPNLIIETGIAHGGSLIMSASMLALLDYCEAARTSSVLDPRASTRRVVGVDIDIRPHNRAGIDDHPLAHMITTIEGSSVDEEIFAQVRDLAKNHDRIMIFLDSNHTHDHVLNELELYAPLTSKGSYCVVWDTGVDDLPDEMCQDRPWGKENNPKTAVREFMKRIEEEGRRGRDGEALVFEYDRTIETKITITASPDGFLRRI